MEQVPTPLEQLGLDSGCQSTLFDQREPQTLRIGALHSPYPSWRADCHTTSSNVVSAINEKTNALVIIAGTGMTPRLLLLIYLPCPESRRMAPKSEVGSRTERATSFIRVDDNLTITGKTVFDDFRGWYSYDFRDGRCFYLK